MKLGLLFPTIFGATIEPLAPGDCSWLHGDSGDHVSCLPGFYIDGTCGSGSQKDCRFSERDKYSFAIHW